MNNGARMARGDLLVFVKLQRRSDKPVCAQLCGQTMDGRDGQTAAGRCKFGRTSSNGPCDRGSARTFDAGFLTRLVLTHGWKRAVRRNGYAKRLNSTNPCEPREALPAVRSRSRGIGWRRFPISRRPHRALARARTKAISARSQWQLAGPRTSAL